MYSQNVNTSETHFYNRVVAFPLIHNLEGHLVCSVFSNFLSNEKLKSREKLQLSLSHTPNDSDLSP